MKNLAWFVLAAFLGAGVLPACADSDDGGDGRERIESFEQWGLDADDFPGYESGDEVVAEYCYYNPHECE